MTPGGLHIVDVLFESLPMLRPLVADSASGVTCLTSPPSPTHHLSAYNDLGGEMLEMGGESQAEVKRKWVELQ